MPVSKKRKKLKKKPQQRTIVEQDYYAVNIIGGTVMKLKGTTMVETTKKVMQLFFDLNKEYDISETERYSENDALMLEGFNNENGGKSFILLCKEKVYNDPEFRESISEYKLIN